jgi:hypothetical protein
MWSRREDGSDWPTQSTGLLYNHDPFALGSLIPDNGGSMYLWNVGRQLFYTAVHPRRQFWTSCRRENLKSHTLISMSYFGGVLGESLKLI